MRHSQIDEVVNSSLKVIVSMPNVETSPNVAQGIEALSISGDAIWFSANGSLYKATLDGRDIQHVDSVRGAVEDVPSSVELRWRP